jgi:UV DNA damage endonuclease
VRVGYPCLNRSIPNGTLKTFRLASYSPERTRETIAANLSMVRSILEFNAAEGLLNFRIASQLIPFASHPVCTFPWPEEFATEFAAIGAYLRDHNMRASLHPDQFTLINSPDEEIFRRSMAELIYHAQILDLMQLDASHKIQIHVGGAYGDKPAAMKRFAERYRLLPPEVQRRLVIENDDRLFTLDDCLALHKDLGVPVLLDVFHHSLNGHPAKVIDCIRQAEATWQPEDGPLMIDYSTQQPGERIGTHAESIDTRDFRRFLKQAKAAEFDLMLEIKDKEKSAVKALRVVKEVF